MGSDDGGEVDPLEMILVEEGSVNLGSRPDTQGLMSGENGVGGVEWKGLGLIVRARI